MGASFTCGYGVEGHHPCSFSPYTENYSKYSNGSQSCWSCFVVMSCSSVLFPVCRTYAAVIARTVGAQYHVECWSGKGVVRCVAAHRHPPQTSLSLMMETL
jgi:hypothetical protein